MPKKIENYYDVFIKKDKALPIIFKELKYLNYNENVPYFINNFNKIKNENLTLEHKVMLYKTLNIALHSELKESNKTKSFLFYASFEKGIGFTCEVLEYFNEQLHSYLLENLKENTKEKSQLKIFKNHCKKMLDKYNQEKNQLKILQINNNTNNQENMNNINEAKVKIYQLENSIQSKESLFNHYEQNKANGIEVLKVLLQIKFFIPYQAKQIQTHLEKYELEKLLNPIATKNKTMKI